MAFQWPNKVPSNMESKILAYIALPTLPTERARARARHAEQSQCDPESSPQWQSNSSQPPSRRALQVSEIGRLPRVGKARTWKGQHVPEHREGEAETLLCSLWVLLNSEGCKVIPLDAHFLKKSSRKKRAPLAPHFLRL